MRKSAIPLAAVSALVCLAGAGLFLGQPWSWEMLDPSRSAGILRGIFVLLLPAVLMLTTFRFTLRSRSNWDEFLLLVSMACGINLVVQATGGARSPWQALYLLLIGLASVSFPAVLVASCVGVVLAVEAANWLVDPAGRFEDLLRLAGLSILSAVGFWYMQRAERRRSERAEEELRKLNLGLERLAEPAEQERPSPLSDEGKRLGRVDHARELERRLGDLLRLARSATGAQAAFLLQAEDPGETLAMRLAVDDAGRFSAEPVATGTGLLAEVLRQDRPFRISETGRPVPEFPWYENQPELHSVLAIPMGAAPRWVLVLVHREPDHFGVHRNDLALALAGQMSEWLASTRHLVELDSLSGEFRRLYQASAELSQALRMEQILNQMLAFCREVTRFETCAICLAEEGEDRFTVAVAEGYPERVKGAQFPLESSTWTGWILRCREDPLVIRIQRRTVMPVLYAGEKTTSNVGLLGIPLRVKNRVSGALVLTRRGDVFSANEQRVLRILCNQAAVAIENARVYERLEQLAATDGLTGLFNRRYFEQALVREVGRIERRRTSLAALMLDIDHFKQLNDTYGHTMGDLVLRKVAEILARALRKGDVLARYGGEEFVILLPDATYRGARDFAERIRKAIASAHIHPGGPRRTVTVSVGWALYPDDTSVWQDVLQLADRALYFAKDTGRNRVAGYHLLQTEAEP